MDVALELGRRSKGERDNAGGCGEKLPSLAIGNNPRRQHRSRIERIRALIATRGGAARNYAQRITEEREGRSRRRSLLKLS